MCIYKRLFIYFIGWWQQRHCCDRYCCIATSDIMYNRIDPYWFHVQKARLLHHRYKIINIIVIGSGAPPKHLLWFANKRTLLLSKAFRNVDRQQILTLPHNCILSQENGLWCTIFYIMLSQSSWIMILHSTDDILTLDLIRASEKEYYSDSLKR